MIKRYYVHKNILLEQKPSNEDFLTMIKYNDIKDNLIEWHSVEEELPEPFEDILIWNGSGENEDGIYKVISVGRIDGSGAWWEDLYGHKDFYRVTHWAYLPKPPKGANND